MQSILVATDLSSRSEVAVERAVSIARKFSARLHVVHFMDEEWPETLVDTLEDRAREYIQSRLDCLDASAPVQAEVSVVFGRPGTDIGLLALDLEADLIVTGRHRHRGLSELFIGGTTDRLIRSTAVPVLVAARPFKSDYARAIVGIDFSKCAANAVSLAEDLVGRANVIPVHAYRLRTTNPSLRAGQKRGRDALDKDRTTQFLLQEAENWAADQELDLLSGVVVLREGSPLDVLPAVASDLDSDLICLGAHGRYWLASMFLGSTTRMLVQDSDFDILIAPL